MTCYYLLMLSTLLILLLVLSAVFDTADHDILISCLEHCAGIKVMH